MVRFVGSVSVLALALSTAACSGASADADDLATDVTSAATTTIHVDASDDGATVDAKVGDTIVLSLASNPSTGFGWSVTGTTRTLGYPAESFEAANTNGPVVGAGGTAKFTWETKNLLSPVGSHSVTLAYRRPWETNVPPARTFTFTLRLKAAPAPATNAVVVDDSADATTVTVEKGKDFVVRLPSNPSTGYGWNVSATDRTFGYPTETFESARTNGPIVGAGGTAVFTWKTNGFLDTTGLHHVAMEYKRPWETNVAPAKTFTVDVLVVDPAAPAPLTLTSTDDGGRFTVARGRDVVVRLPSNPSTGYSWGVTSTNRTFGYPKSSTYEADPLPPGSGPVVGGGGTEVFTWSTSSGLPMTGTHTVRLGYRRPWETNVAPIETFTFTVTITP
ncbi:MAG: protease inhibitor I42 family protein [Polyangiaceae bacterium]